jgi:ribose-phosphate pyrophosphokinase
MITANIPFKSFQFPCGERHVTVDLSLFAQWPTPKQVDITFLFRDNADIFELLLVCDAVQRAGGVLHTLTIPYVPYARQDRVNTPGESLSLKVFTDLINSLKFPVVYIDDPHSDVTTALLDRVEVNEQHELLVPLILGSDIGPFYLVAPDAGALKKTHKLAKALSFLKPCLGVIESSKERNTATGEITGTVVHASGLIRTVTQGDKDIPITYVIADDICDGGRTFIELAKELRSMGAERVQLFVAHGFFTKGRAVVEQEIDVVTAFHNHDRA